MFLGSPLPSWKQIFTCNKKRPRKTFYEDLSSNVFFMAESCMSIRLILNAFKEVSGQHEVKILLPDFFCNETICSFNEEWVNLCFYPVKADLDPDWDYLKKWSKENQFDIFLFTHYFGEYHENISRGKELCKNHNAILIEDCAHVLYPTGKMGTNGDFVIYSPHKQLPIMDGGILVCRGNGNNLMLDNIRSWIKDRYDKIPENTGTVIWYIKKVIQKLVSLHKTFTYYNGIHNGSKTGGVHEMQRMSKASYNILCDFEYIDLKKIAYTRRDNLEMMNYIISQKYPAIMPFLTTDVDIPYVAVYSLEKVKDKRKTTDDMIADGMMVMYWPDLPYQMNNIDGHEDMKRLSENLIVLPIHQDINHQQLVKKFLSVRKEEHGEPSD